MAVFRERFPAELQQQMLHFGKPALAFKSIHHLSYVREELVHVVELPRMFGEEPLFRVSYDDRGEQQTNAGGQGFPG